jgi:hypothetical protein
MDAPRLEAEILDFLRAEIPAEAPREDPMDKWYRQMYLDRGNGFAPYDDSIIKLLEENRERFDRLTEIGAGVGASCLHFSLEGWRTVAIEAQEQTYQRMLRLLSRIPAPLRERVTPVRSLYPNGADAHVDNRTLLCCFGIRAAPSPEAEHRMLQNMGKAGGIVLDPRAFFRRRDQEEQKLFIEEIRQLGFEAPSKLWRSQNWFPYEFLLFMRPVKSSSPHKKHRVKHKKRRNRARAS